MLPEVTKSTGRFDKGGIKGQGSTTKDGSNMGSTSTGYAGPRLTREVLSQLESQNPTGVKSKVEAYLVKCGEVEPDVTELLSFEDSFEHSD